MVYKSKKSKKNFFKKTALFFFLSALFFAFVFIFSAHPVFAWDADGMMGAGVAGIKDLFSFISGTILWIAAALAALWITTTALQWLVNNQTSMISFDNGFVSHGLAVTQGLADLLLLLAFVVAAFCIILKLFDFEAKKIMPKLIFAAIATRFGVLLVKMVVDIGNICINTIMANNGDVLMKATNDLMVSAVFSIAVTLTTMTGLMFAYAIPVVNLIAIGLTIGDIATAAASILGHSNYFGDATVYFATNFVARGVFQIFASTILSGIYLSYIILFVSRIFMLQILAVISPLAIMSYGLPQTRQYFTRWWNSLIKWAFVGVWTLFFLILGLGSSESIMPKTYDMNSSGGANISALEGMHMDNTMLYYLFLIIYLALVKSMTGPDAVMAEIFRTAAVGAGGIAMTHIVQPALKSAQRGAMKNIDKIDDRAGTDKERFYDGAAKHLSGLTANLANKETMSSWTTGFSGDPTKVSQMGANAGKKWDFSKPQKWSNVNDIRQQAVREAGKDNTIENVMSRGENASAEEVTWAMQTAKPEDLSGLFASSGKNLGRNLDYAKRHGLIKTSVIEAAGRTKGGIEGSRQLREYYKKQDENHGNEQLKKVQQFLPRQNDKQKEAEEDEKMLARVMNLKSVIHNKEAIKTLPDSVFQDENNVKAMLIAGDTNMLGYIKDINSDNYDKLGKTSQENFDAIARANPKFVEAMALDPSDIPGYGKFIPKKIKAEALAKKQQDPTLSDADAMKAVINKKKTGGRQSSLSDF